MNFKIVIPMIAIAALWVACKKSNITAPVIIGKWELRHELSSSEGINESFSPANGNSYQFNSDNSFTQFKNDTVSSRGTYSIKKNAETINGIVYDKLLLNNAADGQVVQVQDSTLSLGLDYNGGIAYIYDKIP